MTEHSWSEQGVFIEIVTKNVIEGVKGKIDYIKRDYKDSYIGKLMLSIFPSKQGLCKKTVSRHFQPKIWIQDIFSFF